VPASARRRLEHDAFKREVVALRSAAGETNFIRIAAQQSGHSRTRIGNRFARCSPHTVGARWIAVMHREKWLHCFHDAGRDRGRGVVIEVNATHSQFLENSVKEVQTKRTYSGQMGANAALSSFYQSVLASRVLGEKLPRM
jgi:hypothetical protein